MNYDKIKSTCRVVRIAVGVALISTGVVTSNALFFLGALPFVAGLVNFCPLCLITKKCTI